jgi:hypothetical protein
VKQGVLSDNDRQNAIKNARRGCDGVAHAGKEKYIIIF